MQAGWRTILRTVAITFAITSFLWIGAGIWWYSVFIAARKVDDHSGPARAVLPQSTDEPRRDIPDQAPPYARSALQIPVLNVSPDQLVDTFTQARDGGERRHDAIDIMAPRGTPVVAAAGGKVVKLFWSDAGGKTVYVRSGDGRLIYYYAHLDSYDPSLSENKNLVSGDRIGTVGSTGNANSEAPHLHFAIWRADSSGNWWEDGDPINPYPLLLSAPAAPDQLRSRVPSGAD